MKTQLMRLVVAATIVSSFYACGADRAQDAAGDRTTKPQIMERDADPDWEVVTVKPTDPNATSDYIDQNGRHLTFANKTVEMLLAAGYNVHKSQIGEVPEWVKTKHWDIDGLCNIDGRMSMAQLEPMIRKVLAERFGLKLHREQRTMSVYALTTAKGGPQLKASTGDPNGRFEQHPQEGAGWHLETMKNASMPELGLILEFRTDRPVVDQTGLTGRYDFQLKWLTDNMHAADADAPPGLFTAIQEQLGLKLEPKKAMVDVLVVDQVQMPGVN